MMKRIIYLILCMCMCCFTHAQTDDSKPFIDSLKQVLKVTNNDTARCNTLYLLIENTEDNEWPIYNQQLKALCELNLNSSSITPELKKFYLSHLSNCINNIGITFHMQGNIPEALLKYEESLKMKEEIGDKKGMGDLLNNLGYIYSQKGFTQKGLEKYLQALKINENLKNENGIATVLNNIATVYNENNNGKLALEYLFKSLEINTKNKNTKNIGNTLKNIGITYYSEKKYLEALNYFNKSLIFSKKSNDVIGISTTFENIGDVYTATDKLKLGIQFYFKSLKLLENQNQVLIKSQIYYSISKNYFKQKNLKEALKFGKLSLLFSEKIGKPSDISRASKTLSDIYSKMNNWKMAFKMHVLYKQMSDSLNNDENNKFLIQKGFEYDYSKKMEADSLQKVVNNKILTLEKKQDEKQRTILYVVIGLIAIFSLFLYNRFRVTRNQKNTIEEQKIEVEKQKKITEEKQKEILDSINYAERIQKGFFVDKTFLNNHLKIGFILFKPKDKVSGDFYWAEKLSNGNIIVAIADCTGHGVPGAFMSLLNISFLKEALISKKITRTSDILNFIRTMLMSGIKPNEKDEGGNDGMDCVIFSINYNTLELEFCGANNNVWIIRDSNLIELKGDKMPVGRSVKSNIPFTNQLFQLQKGDMLYAATDGYADQFGGEKQRKFMTKKLKETLLSIHTLHEDEQKQTLETLFENYKGNLEQVDDVTVFGVRI